ncbi:thiamine pyrophosphate-requiring protein [Rathayibacter sp. VKM Ac-2630]|uniref:thiamine pyrophosphate-requiring protein n=1 Tax=Rathayibacter sp. VKM Ac-2630 TaxID=1938617 RepID=UPI0009822A2C|nr:thiamine pyrophosphate-requiring protein [Rathayibacter sp. VKM Ac-2630]OOB92315.1 thiamine pyrophosphate-requiring protein [Rathayibacter sp. VKM Ac-2630]
MQERDQPTTADLMVDRLREWGVERIFGYSGDGINGFMEALRRGEDAPRFVQARHEEAAAFMAVGHAKFTGGVGVVTSTQGPGAVHLLNGLYDAKLDGVPVVAIVGQQNRTVLGSGYMQEIDLRVLFADVAAQFCQLVSTPEQLPMVLDRAFRSVIATRSPTVVIVPHDVQTAPPGELPHEHGTVPTAVAAPQPVVLPREDDLERATSLLAEGERVAVFVGQGARHARAEVETIARRLGAGITTSLLGKPYVDETLPFSTGTMGHLGTTASAELLDGCDTLLIVGSDDPWTEFYPAPGQARAVQIDLDARAIGNRYPIEVGLVGDAAATLSALLERLPERVGWRGRVAESVERWRGIAQRRAAVAARPVNPERVLRELDAQLPEDARIAVDVGSVVYWYARQLHVPAGAAAHLSGTLASMGCSVPYGIAAKLADPSKPVVVLAGDGAMQMLGLAELITVARLATEWADPRFVVCVLSNRDLAEVSWEQREMEEQPRFEDSQALPDVPFAAIAELLGFRGIRVEDPEALAGAWREAFACDRPVLIEVVTDRDVPLLPPFPAGEEKSASMRTALEQEGAAGAHALALLEEYASHER